MYFIYILKSLKNNKYYIGYSSDINRRLVEHNNGKSKYSKLYRPWVIYYFERFETEKEAMSRERQIKSWKSRKMIEKLKLMKIGTTPESTP